MTRYNTAELEDNCTASDPIFMVCSQINIIMSRPVSRFTTLSLFLTTIFLILIGNSLGKNWLNLGRQCKPIVLPAKKNILALMMKTSSASRFGVKSNLKRASKVVMILKTDEVTRQCRLVG